jgi:hypothetical protein
MAISKGYTSQFDVAYDIIDAWEKYAFQNLFDITSFLLGQEVDNLNICGGQNFNLCINITKIENSFHLRCYENVYVNIGAGERNVEEKVHIDDILKDLKSKLNNELVYYVLIVAESIITQYSSAYYEKQKIISLIEDTRKMDGIVVGRKFLIEKM